MIEMLVTRRAKSSTKCHETRVNKTLKVTCKVQICLLYAIRIWKRVVNYSISHFILKFLETHQRSLLFYYSSPINGVSEMKSSNIFQSHSYFGSEHYLGDQLFLPFKKFWSWRWTRQRKWLLMVFLKYFFLFFFLWKPSIISGQHNYSKCLFKPPLCFRTPAPLAAPQWSYGALI